MRRSFVALMDLLGAEPRDDHVTLGWLAMKYDEPVERVMDALEACKERGDVRPLPSMRQPPPPTDAEWCVGCQLYHLPGELHAS